MTREYDQLRDEVIVLLAEKEQLKSALGDALDLIGSDGFSWRSPRDVEEWAASVHKIRVSRPAAERAEHRAEMKRLRTLQEKG